MLGSRELWLGIDGHQKSHLKSTPLSANPSLLLSPPDLVNYFLLLLILWNFLELALFAGCKVPYLPGSLPSRVQITGNEEEGGSEDFISEEISLNRIRNVGLYCSSRGHLVQAPVLRQVQVNLDHP